MSGTGIAVYNKVTIAGELIILAERMRRVRERTGWSEPRVAEEHAASLFFGFPHGPLLRFILGLRLEWRIIKSERERQIHELLAGPLRK